MKILVADDSGIMRKIIIRSLHSIGMTDVVEAANGREAVELFKLHGPDLVLTDWN
ncbi:MAG: response regulator, partial [Pirellula sp.]